MRSSTRLLAGLALGMVLAPEISAAQSTLGELLDAGAKKVSAQELKRDIVGHAFAGPLPTIGNIEIAYLPDGTIQGQSPEPGGPTVLYPASRVTGEWTIDDVQRLCSTVRIQAYGGQWANRGVLPTSCQFWYKLGDVYFVSDSDRDRKAKVVMRTPMPQSASLVVGSGASGAPKPSSASPGPEYGSLGELLDAGAKKISMEDFKREIVQRTVAGPTPAGGEVEVVYTASGMIQGVGTPPIAEVHTPSTPVRGDWTVDDSLRVCTSMQMSAGGARLVVLPQRCQYWFNLGDVYYVADSDSDRRAKVLRREVVHRSPGAVATPSNLGELLDAGAKRLSADEFKRNVVQRTLVGYWSSGSGIEIMYAANGSIQGSAQPSPNYPWNATVSGEWSIGAAEKVCTAMQMGGGTGRVSVLSSCQTWFKLGNDYFIADSDSDRRAQVLRRTIKR